VFAFAALLGVATLEQVRATEIPTSGRVKSQVCAAQGMQVAIASAEADNKAANEMFGRKLYDEAIASYSSAEKGLRRFTQTGDNPAAEVVLCKVLCNRAAASLGAGYHREALSDCNAALSLDPALGKAVLRRGMARESLGQHEEAHEDAVRALGLFGFGSPMGDAALALRRRLDKLLAQRARAAVEPQPSHLFNRDQTLRLNFHTPPPAAVALRAYFQARRPPPRPGSAT